MSLGLSMQQQQRLVMTPELRQALAVLQLPVLELGQYLEQELHTNPLLELQAELEIEDHEEFDAEVDPDFPEDWAEYFDDGPHSPADVPVRSDTNAWRQDIGDRRGPTLHEHLLEQLRLTDLADDVRQAARVLAGNLDDNGWLSSGAAEIGRQYGWSDELTAAAVSALQACDPAGVGAADLRECLLLQWQRRIEAAAAAGADQAAAGAAQAEAGAGQAAAGAGQAAADPAQTAAGPEAGIGTGDTVAGAGEAATGAEAGAGAGQAGSDADPVAAATGGADTQLHDPAAIVPVLIEKYLEDLAERRITRIAAELGVEAAVVQGAADLLRTLDPIPGRRFAKPGDVRYVVPDVTIERVGDEFVVLVNEASLPRLAVNPMYRRLLRDSGEETREYLQRKLQSALWFLRSIEQRRLTLYRVAETIIDMQRDFFLHGIRSLRPLTLREVATAIGVHESTVSRAVANKHAQTPHGIFELRFFFDSGIDGAIGGGLSAASIKRRLQELIEREDRRQPLSDQQLADTLKRDGIPISRRTVAKYREEMGIASSPRRRRFA